MPSDSVKVAVRVRPFNQREKSAKSKCIISMSRRGATTLTNPDNNKTHNFSFDHSYWSHDGYEEDADGVYVPTNHQYADQRQVFNDLGQGVLDNAWQGYNAALFAYGQTGSGKSYSMIGYGANKGIVPITCDELFKAIRDNDEKNKQLQVTFSMLEIYNEQVRDLLAKPVKGSTKALKVRLNPQTGFYVDGLKAVPVKDYNQIEDLMDQGTLQRTTASTNMNSTSSRSHMVITIQFKQVYNNNAGENTTKSSEINLVDLAGSERAKATGATGDRLKEGSAINVSLSMLGNVISALADKAIGKKVIVPYRNSVLTKLLQNALGGNSKTIMIAALSPADINFEETLSTLRYADRAKKIQNKAVVNESPTERLIRELREENARLLQMMKSGNTRGSSSNDIPSLLLENERQMEVMNKTWEQRLHEAREEWKKSQIHSLGNGNKIELKGLGIQLNHSVLKITDGKVTITKVGDSRILINGKELIMEAQLTHQDRIIVGSNSLFLYIGFPSERLQASTQDDHYSYDFFQSEVAENQGFMGNLNAGLMEGRNAEGIAANQQQHALLELLLQDFSKVLPMVQVVNAVSKELNRGIVCEPFIKNLATHDSQGRDRPKEVALRVTNVDTNQVWVWSMDKFDNRRFLIEELYRRFQENPEEALQIEQVNDPFWDPVEDVHIGCCHVWLINLGYLMDIEDEYEIKNDQGKSEGVLSVKIIPCDVKGRVLGDEWMVLDPSQIIGSRLDFIVSIQKCGHLKWIQEENRRGVYCKFDLFDYPKSFTTKTSWHMPSAQFGFRKQITIKQVTEELLLYLQTQALVIDLWGTQFGSDESPMMRQDIQLQDTLPTISLKDTVPDDLLVAEESELAQLREGLRRQSLLNDTLVKENELIMQSNIRLRHSLDAGVDGVRMRRSESDHGLHRLKSAKEDEVINKRHSADAHKILKNSQENPTKSPPSILTDAFTKPPTKPPASDAAEFGKVLKTFFQNVKPVKKQLKALRQSYDKVEMDNLDSVKNLVEYQKEELESLEANLTSTLASLRSDVGTIIRDRRKGSQTV